ncbi:hypothetical protein ACW9HF_15090 [Nocardia gipuzkoensis]
MTSWLPLISSLVIASVTFFGIRINNRTNLAAIAAADEREYRKWQRETVLRQCGEAIETALQADHDYWHVQVRRSTKNQVELKAATEAYWRKLVAMLRMLDADGIAESCRALQGHLYDAFHWADLGLEDAENLDSERFELAFEKDLDQLEELRQSLERAASAELRRLGRPGEKPRDSPFRTRFLRGCLRAAGDWWGVTQIGPAGRRKA